MPNSNAETRLLPGAWLVVGLLWFVACLNYLDRNVVTNMRGSIISAIPMTDAEFGLLTSAFLWVYGGLSPFAGFLADRFRRSHVIIGSVLVWSVVTFLTGHAKTLNQLLVTRALMGLSEACYLPAALALITDYHRGSTRSFATGLHLSGLGVGAALAGFGGWLAQRYGWSFAFGLFGAIGILYSLILAFGLRDAPSLEDVPPPDANRPSAAGFFEALLSLFSRGSYYLMLGYWGMIGLAGWAVMAWMPTYFQQQFNLDQGSAGISTTTSMHCAVLVGLVVGGLVADRWSRVHARGRIYAAIIGMAVAGPGVFLAANTVSYKYAVAGVMIFGFARAFTDCNTMPILCMVVDPRYRATAFGVLNFFANTIGGVTTYAGGRLRDANINVRYIFECGALGMLICAVLLAFVRPAPSQTAAPGLGV
jgi:MFS family permease